MKTKGFLVCFTGIDGAGKTTLSKELVELLNKKGIECKYVYGRLNPFFLKPFIVLGGWIFLRKRDITKNYSEYANTKRKAIKKYSFFSRIYQKIFLFDYLLQILFKVKLPLIFGKNIVCDRYVYDTAITDLSVDMGYSHSEIRTLIKKFFYIAPKPNLVFLMDLPEEIAFQRKDDTPSIEYLKERRRFYLDVGKEEEMIILNGSKNLDELKRYIQKSFYQHIEGAKR